MFQLSFVGFGSDVVLPDRSTNPHLVENTSHGELDEVGEADPSSHPAPIHPVDHPLEVEFAPVRFLTKAEILVQNLDVPVHHLRWPSPH